MATSKQVFIAVSAVLSSVAVVAIAGTVQAHEGHHHEAPAVTQLTANDLQPAVPAVVLQGSAPQLQAAPAGMLIQPAGNSQLQ